MKTKLVLELEQDLIDRAKRYAETSGKSVSQIVAKRDNNTKLTLAQVAIQPDLTKIKRKMLSVLQAAEKDEWVIFPEGTLSGYFPEQDNYFRHLDKAELEQALADIA